MAKKYIQIKPEAIEVWGNEFANRSFLVTHEDDECVGIKRNSIFIPKRDVIFCDAQRFNLDAGNLYVSLVANHSALFKLRPKAFPVGFTGERQVQELLVENGELQVYLGEEFDDEGYSVWLSAKRLVFRYTPLSFDEAYYRRKYGDLRVIDNQYCKLKFVEGRDNTTYVVQTELNIFGRVGGGYAVYDVSKNKLVTSYNQFQTAQEAINWAGE